MRIKRKKSEKKRKNCLQIKNKNKPLKIYLHKDEKNVENFLFI